MNDRAAAGFTLLELLIALALTAMVAVGAMAALDSFTAADRRTSESLEVTTAVGRALQTVRRDLSDAVAVDVGSAAWVATLRDGSAIGYAIAAGGTELHRFVAADAVTAANLARAALTAVVPAATYTARGHLQDSDYRPEAILQGAAAITVVPVTRVTSTLGVQIAVRAPNGAVTQCVATSLVLLETNGKVAAATGGSGSGSGGGLIGGLLDGLGGVLSGSTSDTKTSSQAAQVR